MDRIEIRPFKIGSLVSSILVLLEKNKNKDKSCPYERKLIVIKSKGLKVKHHIKVTFQVIYNFMKELCLHDIGINTNFHQNRSISEL